MRTFSKIMGLANLRIGYGITTPEIAAVLQRTRQPFNANGIAQAGAVESYNGAFKGTNDYADIAGADVVLNCVGPFYKTVKTILSAVIEARVNYVDVCDDVDVTLDILAMDESAKRAGITALIGMGSSPGATNIMAKLAAESLLEETDSIEIFHAHGGEPIEGEGVIGHRFHCMSIDIPMFLDGELKYVKYFEPDGIALRQTFDFPVLGKNILVYPYPHPEQLTLPKYIRTPQVTNKGAVLPSEYYAQRSRAHGCALRFRRRLHHQTAR